MVTVAIIATVALGIPAAPGDDLRTRILHFPADRAVGIVHTRPPHQGPYKSTLYVDDWKWIGDARGDITVPRDAEVRLDVANAASRDLSFLQTLREDDLQALNLRNSAITDDGLELVGRLTGLLILDLYSTRVTDEGVRSLKGLTRLRDVDLNASGIDRKEIARGDGTLRLIALAKWKDLERISVGSMNITDQGLAALVHLKSLTDLVIVDTAVTDAGLAQLQNLPRLEALQVGMSGNEGGITDAGLEHVGELRFLKQLTLRGPKITNQGLEHLRKLISLEYLSLDSTNVTEAGLAHLAPLVNLRHLHAYFENFTTDVGARHLSKLKSLRRLSMHLELTDEGLRALAELPEFENLDLVGAGVTDAATAHLARMKSLKEVWFQECPVTDAAMERLGQLVNLESLLIGGTQVSGNGFAHLANLKKLSRFAINFGKPGDMFHGTDPTLRQVGELKSLKSLSFRTRRFPSSELKFLEGLEELESLEISELPVDDDSAVFLGSLQSLKHLRLDDSILTDTGLSQLSTLRELKSLTVSGRFTPRGLEFLKRLKSLSQVQLASPNISQEDMQALTADLPALQSAHWYSRRGLGDDVSDVTVSERDNFRREGARQERVKLDALEQRPSPDLNVGEWLNVGEEGVTGERLRRKVVLVHFFRALKHRQNLDSFKKLEALHEKYGKDGLVIIGIHATDGDEAMPDFVAQHRLSWPVASDAQNATASAWEVTSHPSYYLVDRSGKLRFARIYRGDLERAIKELLADK